MSRPFNRNYSIGFGGGGVTYYVQWLMFANIAVFVVQLLVFIAPAAHRPFMEYLAYSNSHLLSGWVWVPVTYMFLHGGLSHLFFNMLQLYFFGPEVERTLGTRQFLRFFLFCGVAAALTNLLVLLAGQPSAPVIGASGAVIGVIVAFAIIDPDREIILFPLPFPITARALVWVLVIINVINALEGGTGIAIATHFGGMAAGYAYMKIRPSMLQWSWQRRSRGGGKNTHPENDEGGIEDEKVKEAVDNIFKFQGKDRR